ncbi:MAG TPA: hypothetical protein VM182_00995 [Terriglobia bacterium]|nr:hypothetical protein [Terriglobia bacterium]
MLERWVELSSQHSWLSYTLRIAGLVQAAWALRTFVADWRPRDVDRRSHTRSGQWRLAVGRELTKMV